MRKSTRLSFRKFGVALSLTAAILMAVPMDALACTGIYVGKDYVENGDVFIGRTEDYDGHHEKDFGVHESDNGSYRYTYARDHQFYTEGDLETYAFEEVGINEKGVAMSATTTTDYNDAAAKADEANSGYIQEGNMFLPVLGKADSAKHACEIMGKIVTEKGLADDDIWQVWLSDKDSSYMFAAVSGHQWVAFELADDVVSVNPNTGSLQAKINLDDPAVMHSENIQKLAVDNGFAKYFEDETFDIFGSYGASFRAHTVSRYYQGTHYFDPKFADGQTIDLSTKEISNPQLFFKPEAGTKYDTYKILRSLATRGEGTKFDSNKGLNTWNLGDADREGYKVYPIGNHNTVESHFFQVRKNNVAGLNDQLRIIQWQAMGPAEFNVFLPLYTGLTTKAPECCNPSYPGEKKPLHDFESATVANEQASKTIYCTMNDINRLSNIVRNKCDYETAKKNLAPLAQYIETVQKGLIADQPKIEAAMNKPGVDLNKSANMLTSVLFTQEQVKFSKVVNEFRDYVNAGDFTKPFTPSESGEFAYASALVGEDGYFKLEAQEIAGIKVVNGQLAEDYVAPSYSLVKSPGEAIDGVKGETAFYKFDSALRVFDSIAIDGKTLVEGQDYTAVSGSTDITINAKYIATLTDGPHNLSVSFKDGAEGIVTTLRVKNSEKEIEVPEKDHNGKTDTKTPKKTNGNVPKTSDPFSVVYVMSTLAAGAACVAYGKKRF